MSLFRPGCALSGAAVCLLLALGTPAKAAEPNGVLHAVEDIIKLFPHFHGDRADLRHLEKALVQLLEVLAHHHHHHHHHHHAAMADGAPLGTENKAAKANSAPANTAAPASPKASVAKAVAPAQLAMSATAKGHGKANTAKAGNAGNVNQHQFAAAPTGKGVAGRKK